MERARFLHARTVLILALVSSFPAGRSTAAVGSLYYGQPVQVVAGGVPLNLGSHAVTRLVDWDRDNDIDLLIGGGDGYVWLFRNTGTPSAPLFQAGARIQSGGVNIRAGTGFTTACLADMTGDGRRDLAVAYGSSVRLYANVGSDVDPQFNGYVDLQGVPGLSFLTPNCNGRMDVADWDEDGRTDIWAGAFDGSLTFFRNVGSPQSPFFAAGEEWCEWPHNSHPAVFDLNQDGRADLTYGINWGYVGVYMNAGEPGQPILRDHLRLCFTDGSELNIRALNNDDTTPSFADLNGDGVIDLVSGGLNGKVWLMNGVPFEGLLERADEILDAHPADLGAALAADPALREELFSLHHGARSYVTSFLRTDESRQGVFDWYTAHILDHAQYLTRRHLDPAMQPYVPYLAGQVWVNLFESLSDGPGHREDVATTCDFQGIYRDLMIRHGVLLIDNSSATFIQQTVVDDYLTALPAGLWDVRFIQIGGYLGPGGSCKNTGCATTSACAWRPRRSLLPRWPTSTSRTASSCSNWPSGAGTEGSRTARIRSSCSWTTSPASVPSLPSTGSR